jgi:hypothetical protein
MAIAVTHPFVSAKGDGSDATLVRPSNWNASHKIVMATNRVIGRLTAGPGDAEELPVTSYMMGLLNTADFAALAAALGLPTTGDAKLTFKLVADAGGVMANDGSSGNALSGATVAHATSTTALFTFFYNSFSDAICPVQTSAGGATTRAAQGTATTAFGNNCRMVLPKTLGRALVVAGAGSGLTNRVVGTTGGEETHVITLGEMPSHGHNFTPAGTIPAHDINHTHQQQGTFNSGTESADHAHYTSGSGTTAGMNANNPHSHSVSGGTWGGTAQHYRAQTFSFDTAAPIGAGTITVDARDINHGHDFSWGNWSGGRNAAHYHGTTISGSTGYMDSNNIHPHTFTGTLSTTATMGSGAAANIMQPWTAWNVMIKL